MPSTFRKHERSGQRRVSPLGPFGGEPVGQDSGRAKKSNLGGFRVFRDSGSSTKKMATADGKG